jgi:hypothetical protein
MLSKIAVAAAVATGAYAAPVTTTDSCTYGAPLSNGNYVFDVKGFSAAECTVFRINAARSIMITGIADWLAATGAGSTADMPVATEWATLGAAVAGEVCPAVAGDPMFGTACSTWSTFNATHPAEIATGIIPDTHTMVMGCIDNMYMFDQMVKGTTNPDNKATAVGNAVLAGYFQAVMGSCEPMMHNPSVAMGGASCKMGDVYGTANFDFGAQSVKCCQSVQSLTAYHVTKTGSSIANLASNVPHCPSHGGHGGCETGTKKPSATAMQNSQDFIREEGCTCGAQLVATLPTDLKSTLDADGDSILDACLNDYDATTTTTTTTTTEAKSDSDSGAAGLTASFAALLVAASAAIF